MKRAAIIKEKQKEKIDFKIAQDKILEAVDKNSSSVKKIDFYLIKKYLSKTSFQKKKSRLNTAKSNSKGVRKSTVSRRRKLIKIPKTNKKLCKSVQHGLSLRKSINHSKKRLEGGNLRNLKV